MLIDLSTPLRGPVDLSPATIVSCVFEHGTPAYPRDKVERIAAAYVARTGEWGFRTSLVVGQSFHETGRYQYGGQVKPSQNNYAGLGATNDGKQGGTFPDEDTGVLAHLAHLGLYVYGHPDQWPEHLKQYRSYAYRLEDVQRAGYLGSVTVLGDFTNGHWAWTPGIPEGSLANGYAAWIAEDANELLAKEPKTQELLTGVPGVPFEVRLIPAGNPNRPAYPMNPQGITVHNTANYNVGANADMHAAFVGAGQGGAENVSFHFVVDDLKIIQLLPLTENAWHAGDGANGTGNRTTVAIEMCDNADMDWDKAFDNLSRLVAELRRVLSVGNEAVYQHNHWSGKDCPRDIRHVTNRWSALLARIDSYMSGQAPYVFAGDDHAYYFTETGHHLSNGFRGYWEQYGGVRVFGYPKTDEFIALDTKLPTQVFEGMVLEYDASAPEDWRVRRRFILTEDNHGVAWETVAPSGAFDSVPK